jgi:hypothetical protein
MIFVDLTTYRGNVVSKRFPFSRFGSTERPTVSFDIINTNDRRTDSSEAGDLLFVVDSLSLFADAFQFAREQ